MVWSAPPMLRQVKAHDLLASWSIQNAAAASEQNAAWTVEAPMKLLRSHPKVESLEWADCRKMICMCTADPERHSSPTPSPSALPLSVHSYAGGCKNSPFGGRGRGWRGVGQRSGLELAPRKSSHCSGSGHRANAHVKRRGKWGWLKWGGGELTPRPPLLQPPLLLCGWSPVGF